jgi:hypothetical protein
MPQLSLEEVVASMAIVDPDLEYYAVTLTVDDGGRVVVDTQSHWIGWHDPTRFTELRAPSLVEPKAMIRFWNFMEQPYVIVKNETEWFVFFQIGGHALVSKPVAEKYLPSTFAEPVKTGSVRLSHSASPFVDLALLPSNASQRAPTPKLRMQVLNRDNRRCRICGCSPANDVHIELHVHHIRPWGRGGHTHLENLITLCHTCHKALDPHEDESLFALLSPLRIGQDHTAAVIRYRERVRAKLKSV